MNRTWLLLDCDHFCHAAFHAVGKKLDGAEKTGTIFGFLHGLAGLADRFSTPHLVFCFDQGQPKRAFLCKGYKSTRKKKLLEKPASEQRQYRLMKKQIHKLRDTWLPALGFRNVFGQEGYEADDVIASIVQNSLPKGDRAVIISSDRDLYQLIGPRVSMQTPRQLHTYQTFARQHGVSPAQWVDVKAIAGYGTDDIPGIAGVGETKAAKFLNGSLPSHHKAYDNIVRGTKAWQANRSLVKLPYVGCNTFRLRQRDRVTKDKCRAVLREQLGFSTLLGLTQFVR